MKLTEEEITKALSVLRAKAPNHKCTMCSHEGSEIAPFNYQIPSYNSLSPTSVGDFIYIPTIATMCPNCGHLEFFRADMLLK
ncbi:MAG: hypothetical protein RRY05_09655 [Bacteroidales bacterium]